MTNALRHPPKRKTCRRYNVPGHAHALTFCCFRRQPFFTSDRVRAWMIDSIGRARVQHELHVWAYVLMPEHVHLLIYPIGSQHHAWYDSRLREHVGWYAPRLRGHVRHSARQDHAFGAPSSAQRTAPGANEVAGTACDARDDASRMDHPTESDWHGHASVNHATQSNPHGRAGVSHPAQSSYDISRILTSLKQSVSKRAILYVQREAPAQLPKITDLQPNGKSSLRFWQRGGGFDRNLWSPKYIWEMIDYIHHNPVRRGLCASDVDWAWSSARAYAGDQDVPIPIDFGSLPDDPRRINAPR